MARARKYRLFPVALSLQSAAEATQLPVRLLRESAYNGTLDARMLPGNRVRVTVQSIIAWLQTFDRATLHRIKKGRKP